MIIAGTPVIHSQCGLCGFICQSFAMTDEIYFHVPASAWQFELGQIVIT